MQTIIRGAKVLEFQRTLIDSLFILFLIIVFHFVNILIDFLSKIIFGNFEFVAVIVQAFGLIEIAYIQTSPIEQINRIMVYLSPFLAYIVLLGLGFAVYSRLKGTLRLLCAWMIAFSFLYSFHASFVGLIFQGGGLGTIEDQVGHRTYSIGLFLVLITIAIVFLCRYKLSPGKPNILSMGLVIFPLYVLFSYNFMTLTESAGYIYKAIVAFFSCFIAITYGKAIESHFLPKGLLLKLLAVPFAILVLCKSVNPPYQEFFENKEALLKKLANKSFPNFQANDNLANAIIVSDEHVNRVLVVYRDGTVKTFIDNFLNPEIVYYDKTKRRLLIAGEKELLIYETPIDNIPEKKIDLTSIGNVEFLIADHNGFIAGYDPNQIVKIFENGIIEPLVNLKHPDSILPLGNDKYLIGSTGNVHHNLYILNMKTKSINFFSYEGEADNIECIMKDRNKRIWLCMGAGYKEGARLAVIDKQNHILTITKAADIEGIVQTKDNQIVFSDDTMNTVYKISNRRGIYPLIHLHDPDDLAIIDGRI